MLETVLSSGLAALKTTFCYRDTDKNISCPVCMTFGSLSEKLPRSHHVNSCLVCRITGEIMNEDNPPMVLPNGNVYSLTGLRSLLDRGMVTCPRTGEVFRFSDAKKAYIS